MKPVILHFEDGFWDGRTLRTDSPDREEAFLACGCYEMSHHGTVGAEVAGLSTDAIAFAQHHGWNAARDAGLSGAHRYVVREHRETETEVVISFRLDPIHHPVRR
jgi:hypothetical protein